MCRLNKIFAALLLILLTSCLRNDMDYPVVLAGITEFKVGLQKSVKIDASARTVVVDLEETADMSALDVESFVYTPGATVSREIPNVLDLTEPFKITFSYYRDYEWTISATQTIERYVNVGNQSGDASINEAGHRIVVSVLNTQSLNSVVFNSMKLGPKGSKIVSTTGYEKDGETTSVVTRNVKFPMTLSCVMDRTFDVLYKGETTTWTLTVVQYTPPVEIKSVLPWAYSIEVKGTFNGAGSPQLQYRMSGDEDWEVWEQAKVAGVGITGKITDLEDDTEYEIRIANGETISDVVTVKTDKAAQIPNSNFDDWSKSGKVWNPYPAGTTGMYDELRCWDTANAATASFLDNVTFPEENFVVKGKAVKMKSTYAAVKFAGGSIYVGDFCRLQGLGADIAWGYPFTSKPKALKGWYHYTPATVNYVDYGHDDLLGKDDIGQFQILLTDWDEQFHVLSGERVFVDFKNAPEIIAFNEVKLPRTEGDQYIEFTLPLEYRSYRTPKYIVIIVCSSFYADDYTGGVGSTLYVDELSLEYE
ncbi:MAG: PCMD domain-containing protein [Bacteroidales bacterium]|nr:PCMD domain-containing protein [Bacteroidales bacterium]